MIGNELGGRYELLERVGGGGMALVYKAHDTLLGRKVAVKILRQQYTSDDDFIRRFRREAQAAASLSHPNIVSVYDVGQDGDVHYIIMEYVEGTNLNEKIKDQAPFKVEEAVHIASQIGDALDHAHSNNIIHRDIKPHNILIGRNGRVKVTDFGIARASSSTNITQTGAVLGSVHYFSPEHAKGVAQGAVSDLYSLGIVLYQMLTNKLPFLGDSPISVALKHLQEKVTDPRTVNPLIPQSVENIILKSMRKNPSERYSSAKQMLDDLDSCLLPERRNEPRLALGPEDEHDNERTLIIPAIRDSQPFDTDTSGRTGSRNDSDRWPSIDDEPRKRSLAWIKPLIWVIMVLAVLGAMWYAVSWLKNKLEVPEVTVPTVIGYTLDEAKQMLIDAGLTVPEESIDYQFSDEYDADIVMEQEKAGEPARQNAPIALVVSKGPSMFPIDNYVGRDYDTDVKNALVPLTEQGAKVEPKFVFSEEPEGTVIKQTPEAETLIDAKKVEIVLEISKGTDKVRMIDVTGIKLSIAESYLTQRDIPYSIKRQKEYAPRDEVFKQWPYEPDELVDKEELHSLGKELVLFVSDGLPDDAAEAFRAVIVEPVQTGEAIHVVITVSDAMGDNQVKKEIDITDTTTFPISLVVSPRKNGVIYITRGGDPYNTVTVTYSDAVNGMSPDRDINSVDQGNDQTGIDDTMIDFGLD